MQNESNDGKKPKIGLILCQLDEICQTSIINGVVDCTKKYDIDLIIYTTAFYIDKDVHMNYEKTEKLLSSNNIDGLIINSGVLGYYLSEKEIQSFCKGFKPKPIVSVSFDLKGYPSILADNRSGISETVSHLIKDHSCRHIAFVRGPEEHFEAEERFAAYKDTLAGYGIPYDERLVSPGRFSLASGADAVHLLLEDRKLDVDAIVCVDDETAIGVCSALQQMGLKVPDDIIVTGFDNTERSQYLTPSLTTVRQPFYEIGTMAVESIKSLIEGGQVSRLKSLPTTTILRESCGCFSDSMLQVIQLHENPSSYTERSNTDELILTMVNTLKQPFIDNSRIENWVRDLIPLLSSDLEIKENTDIFLSSLYKILIEYQNARGDIMIWHNILSILHNNIFSINAKNSIYKFDHLFQKARILICDMSIRFNGHRSSNYEADRINLLFIGRTILMSYDFNNMLDEIEEALVSLEISDCFIVSYRKAPGAGKPRKKWNVPKISILSFAYKDNKRIKLENGGVVFDTNLILPRVDGMDLMPCQAVMMPLYAFESQFGYIIFKFNAKANMFMEYFRDCISTAINGAILLKERKKAEDELKTALEKMELLNCQLKNQSTKDELTSIYNRRGFFESAQQQLNLAKRLRFNLLLFYIDLDGLKIINDTYGHNVGDRLIKDSAKVLMKTFRRTDIIARFDTCRTGENKDDTGNNSIIARLGGDEFVVLLFDASCNIESLKKRLRQNIDKYNRFSRKPYRMSMSIGAAEFDSSSGSSLSDLLAVADENLYREKESKKSVSRI